jgi:ribosomal protein S18 acetylase RimI-like enzyme
MKIKLRPMREHELPAFVAEAKEGYVRDMSENGVLDPEAARAKAEDAFARLLPEGLTSPGQFLFVIEDEGGTAKGALWFAEEERNARPCAFLYDIRIDEPSRGRGIGRLAMQLLEQEVSARGLDAIELNVFAGNGIARSLYRSLGYVEKSVGMRKRLRPGTSGECPCSR